MRTLPIEIAGNGNRSHAYILTTVRTKNSQALSTSDESESACSGLRNFDDDTLHAAQIHRFRVLHSPPSHHVHAPIYAVIPRALPRKR